MTDVSHTDDPRNLDSLGAFATLHRRSNVSPEVNDYDPIAPAFDAVMGQDFHDATHHLRQGIAAELFSGTPLRCLDLCSGTGLFLDRLSQTIPLIGHGLDLSRGQVDIAIERNAGGRIQYSVADVTIAAFPNEMDLVSINFDALNHLPTPKWHEVLARSRESLRPGGALILDVNLPDRLTSDWEAPEVIIKDDFAYVQLGLPFMRLGSAVTRRTPMIVFRREASGSFLRSEALIEQHAIPLQELVAQLIGVGFSTVDIIQDSSASPKGHIFNKNRAFLRANR